MKTIFETGDVVIYYRVPTSSDWHTVGEIGIKIPLNCECVVTNVASSANRCLMVKYNGDTYGWYPKEVFKLKEEMLPDPNKFVEGQYIVTLKGDFTFTDCGKPNYCFKVRDTHEYLRPVVDLRGSNTNGNGTFYANKSQGLKDWRFATKAEIARYDELKKPYDVTTLTSEEGLLAKAKELFPIGTKFKSARTLSGVYEVTKDDYRMWSPTEITCNGHAGPSIYKDGTWSEIITLPTKSKDNLLLEEAARKYPIGTRIVSAHSGKEYTITTPHFIIDHAGDVVNKNSSADPVIYSKEKDCWSTIIGPSTLIAEAKKRYPIGTKFYPAHLKASGREHCIVTNDNFFETSDSIIAKTDEGDNCSSQSKYGNTTYNRNVYYKGTWATPYVEEVKEKEVQEDPLITEAKRRYPIGTRFYPAHIGPESESDYCVVTNQRFRVVHNDVEILTDEGSVWTGDSKDKKYGNTSYNRVVRHDGKWATVAPPLSEVKAKEAPSLSKEELLEKATKDYPIGTRYESANPESPGTHTVQSTFMSISNRITDNRGGSVYCNGKWAKIVSKGASYKFNVGDKVQVKANGSGCSTSEIGQIVTITEQGAYGSKYGPGYKVSPPIGNTLSKSHDGYIGEDSFIPAPKEEFKVGDWAVIDNLEGGMTGIIGHKGEIVSIDYGLTPEGNYYRLEPHCRGGVWKAKNLKKIPKPVEEPKGYFPGAHKLGLVQTVYPHLSEQLLSDALGRVYAHEPRPFAPMSWEIDLGRVTGETPEIKQTFIPVKKL